MGYVIKTGPRNLLTPKARPHIIIDRWTSAGEPNGSLSITLFGIRPAVVSLLPANYTRLLKNEKLSLGQYYALAAQRGGR